MSLSIGINSPQQGEVKNDYEALARYHASKSSGIFKYRLHSESELAEYNKALDNVDSKAFDYDYANLWNRSETERAEIRTQLLNSIAKIKARIEKARLAEEKERLLSEQAFEQYLAERRMEAKEMDEIRARVNAKRMEAKEMVNKSAGTKIPSRHFYNQPLTPLPPHYHQSIPSFPLYKRYACRPPNYDHH